MNKKIFSDSPYPINYFYKCEEYSEQFAMRPVLDFEGLYMWSYKKEADIKYTTKGNKNRHKQSILKTVHPETYLED